MCCRCGCVTAWYFFIANSVTLPHAPCARQCVEVTFASSGALLEHFNATSPRTPGRAVHVAFVRRAILGPIAGVLVVVSLTTFAASIGARAIAVMTVLLVKPNTRWVVIHSKIGKGEILLLFCYFSTYIAI